MATIHQKLAVFVVLMSLLGALWAGYSASHRRVGERLHWLAWLTVALTAVEAIAGVAAAGGGARPSDPLHFVFGPAAVLALPAGLLISRARSPRAASVIVLAAWLITLVLSLRAAGTGGALN